MEQKYLGAPQNWISKDLLEKASYFKSYKMRVKDEPMTMETNKVFEPNFGVLMSQSHDERLAYDSRFPV